MNVVWTRVGWGLVTAILCKAIEWHAACKRSRWRHRVAGPLRAGDSLVVCPLISGKWEGAHVAVKVARVPIKVQQHAEGVQPTPVTPYCCQVAHPNLVSWPCMLTDEHCMPLNKPSRC